MANGVRRLSTVLWWASGAAILLLPMGIIAGLGLGTVEVPVPEAATASGGKTVAALTVGLVPVALVLWILLLMRRLFGLFREGRALSEEAAGRISRMGQALAALALAGIVVPTIQILVVTMGEGPGGRTLSIAVSFDTVALLLTGGLMALIGAAMREGAALARENAGFV